MPIGNGVRVTFTAFSSRFRDEPYLGRSFWDASFAVNPVLQSDLADGK